jgi:hypothetical protein
MLDYQTKGYSRFGASMGRTSNLGTDSSAVLQLRPVPIDAGGYDPGGAYWGTPSNLYHVTDGEGGDFYTRAKSAEEVRAVFPRASWADNPAEATEEDLADMVLAYAEAALWSSTGEDETPLDENYTEADISEECRAEMRADCERFAKENAVALRNVIGARARAGGKECSWSSVGHDFWLTRNGHGCGFWDGDYPEPEDKALTDASKGFGEVYLYVGDDGKIYG